MSVLNGRDLSVLNFGGENIHVYCITGLQVFKLLFDVYCAIILCSQCVQYIPFSRQLCRGGGGTCLLSLPVL